MSNRGGYRSNAGRPRGSRNKRSLATLDNMKGDSPLEFLIGVYTDDTQEPRLRIDAAKAAAPFLHAKLSSIELNADVNVLSHEDWLEKLS